MSNTSRRHALPIAVALTISTAALVLFIREASAQEATKPAPETPAATETPPAATNSSPPPATAGGETKPKSPELPEVKIIQEKEPPKPVEEAAPKPKKKPAPVAEYYDPAPAPQKVKKKSPSKPKTVPTVEASGPSEPATSDGATSIADGTAAGGSVPAKGTGFGTRTADTAGKGYAAPDATTATKTNAPVFETPFSVQTVPSDMIADQAVTRVDQALKNVSGVQINREGIFDGITLRGFKQGLDRWVYRDGAPFINQTFDFANIDRVEVLKGTAGGIYGRIDPGGLVNFVTKKPLAEPHFAIEQEVRSFGGYRTVGDVTGPVTNDGSLRYRTIVAFEDSDSFRDLVGSQNILVSPSISWDLTPTTELYVNYEYRHLERVFDLGIPVINGVVADVPRNRYYGLADQPPSETDSHLIDAHLTQKLSEGWTAKLRGSYQSLDQLSFDSEPSGFVAPDSVSLYYSKLDGDYRTYFLEGSLVGDTRISDDVRNRMFASVEYFRTEGDPGLGGDGSVLTPLNIRNPVYQSWRDVASQPLSFGLPSVTEWTAISIQEQITLFDRLDLFAGGRWDWAESASGFCPLSGGATRCPSSTVLDTNRDDVFNPRGGVNFRLLPQLAIFGSYSESFGPVVGFGRLADGSLPEPTEATEYEIGTKYQTLDGRLSATVAAYELTRTNINTPVPGQPFVVDQTGEARSRGLEVDVSGQLTERLQVIANYAYTDVEITEDIDDAGGPGNTGNALQNIPRHQAGLWLQYDLLSGWGVGVGIYAVGERWGDDANTFKLAGYARVDAGVSYSWDTDIGTATAQFNVLNIFDEEYFVSATYVPAVLPGDERTFIARLRFEN